MLITRFGHSCVLVEVADARILIDPGIFTDQAAFRLTDLSAIVVTHQHPDHIDRTRIDVLAAMNPDALLIAETQTHVGLPGWQENAAGVTYSVDGATITGVGRMHAPILPMIPQVGNVGVTITAPGSPVFFHPGDTYEHRPEGVHVLALPLTAPWAKISETVEFVQAVGAPIVFPIHDAAITEEAYDIYYGQIATHGNVEDLRKISAKGHLEIVPNEENAAQ
ncbi:MAG: MBL fold metallo-hydrolase [Aeromicrobium sp.]|jgi:L-ascorbate metabolism protein UlaG (beta-lactamase superfamily)|nr:MAG: MBL fold metallo-hydrolase [Aeromicrobium sp.]